ncbi:MAG: MFS transporter [Actinobacteria bacterium]|nr:MFS transporter [Actinomycetota bacterium]
MPAPARPATPAPARPTRRGPVLIALMATMALSAMDNTVVATVIPQVVRDLGGFSLFSWIFSAYLLTQTVTIPVYGKLADLWGRKPVLIAGAIVFLAGSALSAGAWNMISLIAFRGLQGLGAGSIMATVNTLAGDLYDLEERGRVQGWLSSVWGISAVVGPALGGSLAQYVSWRWIFVINLPLGAAAITLIGRYLHERVARARHRIDLAGGAAILVAAGALIFGLVQGGVAWPWWSVPSLLTFAAALAATAVAVAVERRAAEPIMPPWFWGRRVLAGSGLAALGLGLLVIGPTTFLATYGQAVLGLGAVAAGAVLATMSIGWPLASAVSARFFLGIGFRNTEITGAAVCLAGIALFFVPGGGGTVWAPVVSTFVLGFGLGLISVCSVVAPQSTVRWHQRGVVTGTVMFCRYLGQGVGAAIFGAIVNAVLGRWLAAAPAALRGRLPHHVNEVGPALTSPGTLGHAAADYLRRALTAATQDVYLALAGIAVLTMVVVLLVPRRFATDAGASAAAGPGSGAGQGGTGSRDPAGGNQADTQPPPG